MRATALLLLLLLLRDSDCSADVMFVFSFFFCRLFLVLGFCLRVLIVERGAVLPRGCCWLFGKVHFLSYILRYAIRPKKAESTAEQASSGCLTRLSPYIDTPTFGKLLDTPFMYDACMKTRSMSPPSPRAPARSRSGAPSTQQKRNDTPLLLSYTGILFV